MATEFEGMTDEQIIEQLLGKSEPPKGYYRIKRPGYGYNLEIDMQGLTGAKVGKLREQCTIKEKKRGRVVTEFDEEKFNCLLISEATIGLRMVIGDEENPRVIELKGWGDEKLMVKGKLSGPDQVVKRLLWAGELDALGNKVLDLSGYNIELEDVKN